MKRGLEDEPDNSDKKQRVNGFYDGESKPNLSTVVQSDWELLSSMLNWNIPQNLFMMFMNLQGIVISA